MKFLRSIVSILAIFAFAACGGGSGGDSGTSTLRVFHNSPDAPNVDVLLDGLVVLSDVPFGASSAFLPVDAGNRTVQVNVAGTDTTVIDTQINIEADKPCTVVASGLVENIRALVLDDAEFLPGDMTTDVRVVHGAPSAPGVDIYVLMPGQSIMDNNATISNLLFGEDTGYLSLMSGEYRFVVTVAGTKDIAIDTGVITLDGNSAVSAFAVDAVGGGAPFSINTLVDLEAQEMML